MATTKSSQSPNKNINLAYDPSMAKASANNNSYTVSANTYNSNISNNMNSTSSSYTLGLATSLGSGYTTSNYQTVATNIGTIFTDSYLNAHDECNFLRLFVLSHNEDEIRESLSKVKEVCITYEDDRAVWEAIIEAVLRTKHFSEDFIINYLDEIRDNEKLKSAILVHHAGDVYSNKYSTVALKILIEK